MSQDGVNFTRFEQPAIQPTEDWERYGCEDPQVTRLEIDGRPLYLITYTALCAPAYSGRGDRVALVSTVDFRTFCKHGAVIPGLNDKDAVIFLKLIEGKIAMLHRVAPNIQIVYFDDLEQLKNPGENFWNEYTAALEDFTILKPEYEWESEKIGARPPPIKTKAGWLLLYHSVGYAGKERIYRTGVALLDLEDPARVVARSPHPILEPEMEYEKVGDVPNVVFPEGAFVKDDQLYVYYGAADKTCCLATARLDDVVDYLLASGDS